MPGTGWQPTIALCHHRHRENVGLLNNFIATIQAARGAYFRWISDSDALEPGPRRPVLAAFDADPGWCS